MLFQKKKFKPIFKQLIRLRENVQNRKKLLNFRKKKWKSFIKFYESKLKNFKKFKPLDHSRYFVTKYGTQGASYNKRFRDTLQAGKRLKLFYGNLIEKYFRKKIKMMLGKKQLNSKSLVGLKLSFLQCFESRLDTVLYRAKFAPTVKNAQQLILHGHVEVNKIQTKIKGYILQKGDIVNFNLKSINLFEKHVINGFNWPAPPKYLLINYRILQILFLGDTKSINIANEFSFNLRLQKILANYYRQ